MRITHLLASLHTTKPAASFGVEVPVANDFDGPLGKTTFRVVVDTGRGPGGVVVPGNGIWGMLSVTNNETQQITMIAPN